MSASASNFAAIVKAKAAHDDGGCYYGKPALGVEMAPYDIDRLGWEEGDVIAGLTLAANANLAPDRFRIVCEGDATPALRAAVSTTTFRKVNA